jgi:hypothetical protein
MSTPIHPVENLAFWKTEYAEIRVMMDKYDALTQGDPVLKQQLDELLAWARHEGLLEESYNSSEC